MVVCEQALCFINKHLDGNPKYDRAQNSRHFISFLPRSIINLLTSSKALKIFFKLTYNEVIPEIVQNLRCGFKFSSCTS